MQGIWLHIVRYLKNNEVSSAKRDEGQQSVVIEQQINHSNRFGRSPESLHQCPEVLRRELLLEILLATSSEPIPNSWFAGYLIKWRKYHGNLKKTRFPESINV